MAGMKKNKGKRPVSKLTKSSIKAKVSPVDQDGIRRRREAKGLTLARAAKLAGFKSHVQWWDVENKPGRDPTMIRIADALGCKVDDILRK
jgi:hypothetical protein